MPKVAVKQKSRQKVKTAARSPFEPGQPIREASDIDMSDDETSSDESSVPEKDEAEKKLEAMLFGDDEGFLGALKNQKDRSLVLAGQSSDEDESAEEGDDDEVKDLSQMDDADVCSLMDIPFYCSNCAGR